MTRREFRRGFTIARGERVLLVDDILTTGGSLLAMIPAVEAMGGEIVGCHVLADRSGGLATLTSPATGRIYAAARAVAAGAAHLRAGPGYLPGLQGGRASLRAGQHGHGRRLARRLSLRGRWRGRRADRQIVAVVSLQAAG